MQPPKTNKFYILQTVVCLLLIGIASTIKGQNVSPDVLIKKINEAEQKKGYLKDTLYFNLKNQLGSHYANNLPDSAIQLLNDLIPKVQDIDYHGGEIEAYRVMGTAFQTKGDFLEARKHYEIAESKAKKYKLKQLLPAIHSNIGNCYFNQGNYDKALSYFYEGLKTAEKYKNYLMIGNLWNNIGAIHFFQGNLDQSLEDYQKKVELSIKINDVYGAAMAYNNIGETHQAKKDFEKAISNFEKALGLAKQTQNIGLQIICNKNLGSTFSQKENFQLADNYLEDAEKLAISSANKLAQVKVLVEIANNLNKQKKYDPALTKGSKALAIAKEMGQNQLIRDANKIIASIYEGKGDHKNALAAFKEYKSYSDSITNIKSREAAVLLKAEFDFSKKELEYKRRELQKNWIIFSALAAFFLTLFFFFLVNRNRQIAKKNNALLSSKNAAIESQKATLENTLQQLKNTQQQLIHSEKMASLGQLSAGIAHEIQNPLNFVNNFSEVSKELTEELAVELAKAPEKIDTILVNELISDINQNLDKINHHGNRASDIIKGMLAHSRTGSDTFELIDINKLTQSAANLAYHGHLASSHDFKAKMELKLEPGLPSLSIKPQEIDRVIFNLINNGFQALAENKETKDFNPLLTVSTKKIADKIHISIKDNGPGISEEIKDKIFMPFFTTKKAGQGTGLGLSLSYEIIKAHNGELLVNSQLGEGAEFIIVLNTEA